MDSNKGMKLRNERLSTLQSVEEQIKEKRMEVSTHQPKQYLSQINARPFFYSLDESFKRKPHH